MYIIPLFLLHFPTALEYIYTQKSIINLNLI